ncbi:MAG: hypothetical protein ACI4MS_02810 [Candidatus Coproplasma sp.]
MGLFRKKKENLNEGAQALREQGYASNEVKSPERMTRKEAANQAQERKDSQAKKDQILEGMNSLRRKVYTVPGYEEYADRLQAMISTLKGMDDNKNKDAMESIDLLIKGLLVDAINHFNRGNELAMDACLTDINFLINERYECEDYYTDREFCQFTAKKYKLEVYMKNDQAKYAECEEQLKKYKKMYEDPNSRISKTNLKMEVQKVKDQMAGLHASIEKTRSDITMCDKSLDIIKMHSREHADDEKFNIKENMDSVFEKQRENDMSMSETDKINEKLSQSHRKISSNALDVNDDVFASNDSEELDDDFFSFKG